MAIALLVKYRWEAVKMLDFVPSCLLQIVAKLWQLGAGLLPLPNAIADISRRPRSELIFHGNTKNTNFRNCHQSDGVGQMRIKCKSSKLAQMSLGQKACESVWPPIARWNSS